MANTATLIKTISGDSFKIGPVLGGINLYQVGISIDTISSDLTVVAGVTGKHLVLIRANLFQGSGAILSIKSASTVISAVYGPTNQVVDPMTYPHTVCNLGQSLVVNASIVVTSAGGEMWIAAMTPEQVAMYFIGQGIR